MVVLARYLAGESPVEGLTPTIKVIDVDMDELIIVDDPMIELTADPGTYKYDLSKKVNIMGSYIIICDANSTLPDFPVIRGGNTVVVTDDRDDFTGF